MKFESLDELWSVGEKYKDEMKEKKYKISFAQELDHNIISSSHQFLIDGEEYYPSASGYLMNARKEQLSNYNRIDDDDFEVVKTDGELKLVEICM